MSPQGPCPSLRSRGGGWDRVFEDGPPPRGSEAEEMDSTVVLTILPFVSSRPAFEQIPSIKQHGDLQASNEGGRT